MFSQVQNIKKEKNPPRGGSAPSSHTCWGWYKMKARIHHKGG